MQICNDLVYVRGIANIPFESDIAGMSCLSLVCVGLACKTRHKLTGMGIFQQNGRHSDCLLFTARLQTQNGFCIEKRNLGDLV